MSADRVGGELRYSHTQVGWWLIVTLGIACLAIVALFSIPPLGPPTVPGNSPRIIGWTVVVALAVTAILLSTLTVRVTSDRVEWHFGPGVVHFSLPLAEITNVAATRTPVLAGIGIHWIFTGWVYNVSGRDAVELTKRDGSKAWIGTDEAQQLAAAIESARLAAAQPPASDASPTRPR